MLGVETVYVCDLKLIDVMRLMVEYKSVVEMLNRKVELSIVHEMPVS